MGNLSHNTEVKEHLAFYMKILKFEMANAEMLEDNYLDFIGNLEKLNDFTQKLYKRDKNGDYPEFTEKDDRELIEYYNNAVKSLHEFQNVMQQSEVKTNPLNKIIGKIDVMLQRDIAALSALKPEDHTSLAQALDRGKALPLKLPKNMSSVGGVSSIRFGMKITRNGESEVGFFTEERKLEVIDGNKIKTLGMNYKKAHPEYAEIFDKMVDAFDGKTILDFNGLYRTTLAEIIENMQKDGKAQGLDPEKTADDLFNALHDDPQIKTYYVPMQKSHSQYSFELNAEFGTSISGRNVAMSRIANLLGMHNIVAESTMADVVDENGKITRGVFMMKAKGVDRQKVMPDRISGFKPDQAETPELLKDIAKMQILDYICQNVDRHESNFMYLFNEDGSKLMGIQGIDNDFSFGTMDAKDDQGLTQISVPLNAIKVVPKALSGYILAMDDSMIKYALADTGLTQKEIAAVSQRMNKVRERIKDGRIRVVENKEWEKMKLNDLSNEAASGKSKYQSLFKIVEKGLNTMQNKAEKNKADMEKNKAAGAFAFKEAENIEALSEASLTEDVDALQSIINQMEASQKKLRIGKGSKEFRDLIDEMKECKEAISDLMTGGTNKNYLLAQAKLESIGEMAEDYLKTKKADDKNKNAQERMAIARNIQEFSKRKVPEFRDARHRQDELEMEKMQREAAKMQAAKRNPGRRNSISGPVSRKENKQNSAANQIKRSNTMSL